MTDFNNTNWAKEEFSSNYLDRADICIVERRKMFAILCSFVSHFMQGGVKRALDLGCGDGVLTEELLKLDPSISATLIDGSEEMLTKAKARLQQYEGAEYIRSSFQELSTNILLKAGFDIVFSSMAIHHLTMDEKKALFKAAYGCLNDGGAFVNIDVVLAPTGALDVWYMNLWEAWMDERTASLGFRDSGSKDIIRLYKDLEENKPDTLDDQMDALSSAGFREVDCYYKYGIFAVYGGMK